MKASLEKVIASSVFPASFWALLIVLPAILLVPLAMGRAFGSQGVVVQITTLMMGNIIVFGLLAQGLTLRLFWQQVKVVQAIGSRWRCRLLCKSTNLVCAAPPYFTFTSLSPATHCLLPAPLSLPWHPGCHRLSWASFTAALPHRFPPWLRGALCVCDLRTTKCGWAQLP